METTPDTPSKAENLLSMIEAARGTGLSQASRAESGTTPDTGDRGNPEQKRHIEETDAILASLVSDIEGDLFDQGGDANESALAAQRLAALAPRLSAGFNAASSGLTQMIEIAQAKREARQSQDNRIDFEEEREKRKREDAERSREQWDDYAESARQRIRADRAATLSQSSLDAMEWEGNSYDVWDFGSLSGSRKDIYGWAKAARGKLDRLSQENGWSEAERAREERLLSDFMKATKEGDTVAARQKFEDMKPETHKAIEAEQTRDHQRTLTSENLDSDVVLRTGSRQSGTAVSVDAGADMVAAASTPPTPSPPTAAPPPSGTLSALSNPPDLSLSDDFTLAAAEQNVRLASVAQPTKAATPVLNQEFSLT